MGRFGIRGKDERGGGFGPLFCSAICGRCHKERIQDVAPQGGLMLSQSTRGGAGGSPLRCADMRWLPAPRLTRPPARAIGFSGVPAANGGERLRAALAGTGRLASRGGGLIWWGGGAAAARPLWGAPLRLKGGAWCPLPVVGARRCRGRRPWPDRSAPLHFRPRAASPAPLRPLCACGRGVRTPRPPWAGGIQL